MLPNFRSSAFGEEKLLYRGFFMFPLTGAFPLYIRKASVNKSVDRVFAFMLKNEY